MYFNGKEMEINIVIPLPSINIWGLASTDCAKQIKCITRLVLKSRRYLKCHCRNMLQLLMDNTL